MVENETGSLWAAVQSLGSGLWTYFEPLRSASQRYQLPNRLAPLRQFPRLGSFSTIPAADMALARKLVRATTVVEVCGLALVDCDWSS